MLHHIPELYISIMFYLLKCFLLFIFQAHIAVSYDIDILLDIMQRLSSTFTLLTTTEEI